MTQTATIDYMHRLTLHMQAALAADGEPIVKSNGYYGDALYRSDVRDALVRSAETHGYVATCAQHGGNWFLRLTSKGGS